jgi:hypothetical protein
MIRTQAALYNYLLNGQKACFNILDAQSINLFHRLQVLFALFGKSCRRKGFLA